ncbi:MAG: diacylglycerol kinase family lipid kinase [Pseudonocardiaceae bacterium]|nr:diacylglycerol kinase family lipid kinase [Pseudonocardiaceae bacterium]
MAVATKDRPYPAIVINPSKFDDLGRVHALIAAVCVELGWAEPLWLETTVSDSGFGQASEAVESGADVVLACGGDGTMRFVAQALAGTGVAMGVLPAGTGNLLARNLDMELNDLAGATRIALTGDDRAVDVGRVRVDDALEEEVFLVMAGMGFDAAIMAGAPAELKARVGPFAYVMAGLRSLHGPRVRISLTIDDEPVLQRRIRTVVVGNCGKLLGGLVLMPDAEVDDGTLDVVILAPNGIVGWAAVSARVLTRRRKGHRRVEHWQAQRVTITAEVAQQAQFDGDPIGDARTLRMRVDPGALLVRVPAVPGRVEP